MLKADSSEGETYRDESRVFLSMIESNPRVIHSLPAPYFEPPWHQEIMYPGWNCCPFYVTADLIWLNARVLWTLLQLAAARNAAALIYDKCRGGNQFSAACHETGVVALRVSINRQILVRAACIFTDNTTRRVISFFYYCPSRYIAYVLLNVYD